MFVGKPVKGTPCTRETWCTLLRQHTGWQAPSIRNSEHRQAQRSPLRAFAWLSMPESSKEPGKEYGWWCPVLNASQSGLAVQSPRPISQGAQLNIQLSFGDRIYSMPGTVTGCTGSAPRLRIGINFVF